jgi:hypothetical protein
VREEKLFVLMVLGAFAFLMVVMISLASGIQPETAAAAPLPFDEAPPARESVVLPTTAPGEHLPLMIRWSNWRSEFGPAYVYAREQDLDGMLRMSGPVEKMLMVTSLAELEQLMTRAGELRASGVTVVGLNTEGGPGMTPSNELRTLNSPNPAENMVARAARLATENGFQVIWGPIRNMADSVSDQAIRTMMTAGVSGLALQEQKFIENQTARVRAERVAETRARYLRLADEVGVTGFSIHVQIMHQRCPNLANCATFVDLLEQIPVDSIAIWSNGPIPPDFVQAIRGE